MGSPETDLLTEQCPTKLCRGACQQASTKDALSLWPRAVGSQAPAETKTRDRGGREWLKSSRDLPDCGNKRQKGQETPWGLGEELDPPWLSNKAGGAGQLAPGEAGGGTQDGGHKEQRGRESPPGPGSSGSVSYLAPEAIPDRAQSCSSLEQLTPHTAWQGVPLTMPPLSLCPGSGGCARLTHWAAFQTGCPPRPGHCRTPTDRRVLCHDR